MPDMIKTRDLYEAHVRRDQGAVNLGGRREFVNKMRHWLGLCDAQGNNYKKPTGDRCLREAKMQPEHFSLKELGYAIIGPRFDEFMNPGNPGSLVGYAQHRALIESRFPGQERALLEATGVGVDVSAFSDINAWTGVAGGLIERKILEQFENPMFIGDKLMPVEPTKVKEGQKVIGAARIGDLAIERTPGMPHARAQFAERYVTLQATRENALACDVYKEAAFFDLTGQVLETAGKTGEWVAYRREIDMIDAFIGGTTQNSTGTKKYKFTYKGTAQDTYVTSLTTGYLNSLSNDLVDWTSVESAWKLFVRMQDPETSTRVLVNPNMVLVSPARFNTAKLIFGATETERRTAIGATQATAVALQVQRTPRAPFGGEFEVLMSPLVEQECTGTNTGIGQLNLSQANADKYWWMWERGRPFRYMQNWPLSVFQAPANSYEMLDRGIVATWFCNERGMPSVWSPWHIVQNTN